MEQLSVPLEKWYPDVFSPGTNQKRLFHQDAQTKLKGRWTFSFNFIELVI